MSWATPYIAILKNGETVSSAWTFDERQNRIGTDLHGWIGANSIFGKCVKVED